MAKKVGTKELSGIPNTHPKPRHLAGCSYEKCIFTGTHRRFDGLMGLLSEMAVDIFGAPHLLQVFFVPDFGDNRPEVGIEYACPDPASGLEPPFCKHVCHAARRRGSGIIHPGDIA